MLNRIILLFYRLIMTKSTKTKTRRPEPYEQELQELGLTRPEILKACSDELISCMKESHPIITKEPPRVQLNNLFEKYMKSQGNGGRLSEDYVLVFLNIDSALLTLKEQKEQADAIANTLMEEANNQENTTKGTLRASKESIKSTPHTHTCTY